MLTYKQSGVDIDEGNRAVDIIKGKIKSTYDNNVTFLNVANYRHLGEDCLFQ